MGGPNGEKPAENEKAPAKPDERNTADEARRRAVQDVKKKHGEDYVEKPEPKIMTVLNDDGLTTSEKIACINEQLKNNEQKKSILQAPDVLVRILQIFLKNLYRKENLNPILDDFLKDTDTPFLQQLKTQYSQLSQEKARPDAWYLKIIINKIDEKLVNSEGAPIKKDSTPAVFREEKKREIYQQSVKTVETWLTEFKTNKKMSPWQRFNFVFDAIQDANIDQRPALCLALIENPDVMFAIYCSFGNDTEERVKKEFLDDELLQTLMGARDRPFFANLLLQYVQRLKVFVNEMADLDKAGGEKADKAKFIKLTKEIFGGQLICGKMMKVFAEHYPKTPETTQDKEGSFVDKIKFKMIMDRIKIIMEGEKGEAGIKDINPVVYNEIKKWAKGVMPYTTEEDKKDKK